jgi:glycosyltransferase involved in cell wall biosynthesis
VPGRAGPPLHIVQVGWDTSLLAAGAASDARERQLLYARLLEERRPGSRMSYIALGADPAARGFREASLVVTPLAGRWRSVAALPHRLRRLSAERAIDVIACQSPLEEAWATLAFARRRLPVVAQVHFDLLADAALPHGSPLEVRLGKARRRLALALLPRYRAVRVVAQEMVRVLESRGLRHVRAIPVPIPDLAALASVRGLARGPRVLFVGRLAPEKNLPLWLEVARRVAAELPAARFDIVGGGAERTALERRAQELGLAEAVTFHGPKARSELPALFGQASVLLLTSDHEGFGRVLVEALAAGVAVASTRTAGAVEVLGEGAAGHLADTGDAEGLAEGVLALLSDPQRREAVVRAGACRIRGRYDPLRLAADWVDMLVEAATPEPAGPP